MSRPMSRESASATAWNRAQGIDGNRSGGRTREEFICQSGRTSMSSKCCQRYHSPFRRYSPTLRRQRRTRPADALSTLTPRSSIQGVRLLDLALIRAVSVLELSPQETARVHAILALPIRHGRSAAYIGSWAVCGHSAASILPGIRQGTDAGLRQRNWLSSCKAPTCFQESPERLYHSR
jgi:hypothetical protein